MSTVYRWIIGLDAHARRSVACVMNQAGEVIKHVRFVTTMCNLIKLADEYPQAVIVLEESVMSQWMYETLSPHAADVFVCNPKHNKWITSGTKSDRLDAEKLAKLYRIESLKRVYHTLDQSRVEFKRAVQYRGKLVRETTRVKNEIKAKFREYGMVLESRRVYAPEQGDEYMKELPSPAQFRLRQLYARLDMLAGQEKEALHVMMAQGREFDEVGRFTQVPGVGEIGACTFSAYVQTPFRFSGKHALWIYASLNVVTQTSDGKPCGRPRLNRQGVMPLKNVSRRAFMGSMLTNRGDNPVAEHYRRLVKNGHSVKTARLTTQRKILSILLHLWKTGEVYNPNLV